MTGYINPPIQFIFVGKVDSTKEMSKLVQQANEAALKAAKNSQVLWVNQLESKLHVDGVENDR